MRTMVPMDMILFSLFGMFGCEVRPTPPHRYPGFLAGTSRSRFQQRLRGCSHLAPPDGFSAEQIYHQPLLPLLPTPILAFVLA
jgi:hypothetical protein